MELLDRWWGRVLMVVLGTALLGAVLALVKGRGYGIGYFVGNMSIPYLVAAFFAGRMAYRWWVACVVGVLATWVTLAGFYASAELVFGYPTGSMTRFYAEWFLAGALSGAVMGLLGRESQRRQWLYFVLPLALVLEPLAVIAVQSAGRFGGLHPVPLQVLTWCGEAVLGLIATAAAAQCRWSRRGVGELR